MPETETPARDAKLIQYLDEALAKEDQLVVALQAHIGVAALGQRKPYKKRLQEHLKETKEHAKLLNRRIKELGGKRSPKSVGDIGSLGDVTALAANAPGVVKAAVTAAAAGPAHAIRGTSEEEKLLKNAKTEYWHEHEEIATYTAIESLAEAVGDKETAKLARQIRRDEEKMANFLEKLIPQLTKAVVKAEIPAAERRASSNGGRSRRSSSSSKRSSTAKRTTAASRSSSSSRSKSSSAKSSGSSRSRSTSAKSSGSGSASKRSSSSRSSGSRSSGSRSKSRSSS